MEVLFIISPNARIAELKKLPFILNDLMRHKIKILYLNIGVNNKEIKKYLLINNYYNYESLINDISYREVSKKFKILKKHKIFNIIVLGLIHKDNITKYLDYYIGTNTNVFVVSSGYGIFSDSTLLINEGAYLFNTIYDLKKISVDIY